MSITVDFGEITARDPESKVVASMNFGTTNVLGSATIASCVWNCVVTSGTDAAAASVIIGACDISAAPTVKQLVGPLVDGVTYMYRAKVTLSDGQIIVGSLIQRCILGA